MLKLIQKKAKEAVIKLKFNIYYDIIMILRGAWFVSEQIRFEPIPGSPPNEPSEFLSLSIE